MLTFRGRNFDSDVAGRQEFLGERSLDKILVIVYQDPRKSWRFIKSAKPLDGGASSDRVRLDTRKGNVLGSTKSNDVDAAS
jgi:hypothetical protein